MSRNGKNRKPRTKQVQKALQRQQEKERAKVAGHVLKLQQLQAGDQSPHIQQINQQLDQLVKGHNELANAYNTNWTNFANSIQHLDARVGAMQLVLDDIVRTGIQEVTKLDAEALGLHEGAEHPQLGGVHWPGYIRTYLKKVEAELALLKQQGEQAQAAPFDPLLTPEAPEAEAETDDVVFGGKDDEDGEASSGLSTGTTG